MIFLCLANSAQAYDIEKISNSAVKSDMVLSTGAQEIFLDPGESTVRNFVVTNRTGQTQRYEIEVEDIKGADGNTPVVFMGSERGPYSLVDYLTPEITQFTLEHAERMTLPITVAVPADAEPGGLYGAVIVKQLVNDDDSYQEEKNISGGVQIVERLASLYYVRIRGDADEQGEILSFKSDKKFYGKPPVHLSVAYKNTGNVHLKPSATIGIKNMLGKNIALFKVDPFFVLPGSTITREKTLDSMFMFGRYTAELNFNHDFEGKTDKRVIHFWVLPWKIILLILAILLFLVYLYHRLKKWFNDNFQRKGRESKE